MSTVTPFLGLTKPAGIEQFSLATYNNNLDAIDAGVLARANYDKADRKLVLLSNGFAWSGGQASWDAGTLTLDSPTGDLQSQITSGASFCSPGSVSGSVKFNEPGMYDVTWVNIPSGEPGNGGYRIIPYGTWPGSMASVILGQGTHMNAQNYWETPVYALGIRVPAANLEIRLIGAQANATNNSARVYVVQRGKF